MAIARNRYRLHDLMRAYAADRAEHEDSREDRDLARRTLLEWYAHHSRAACRVLYPVIVDWHPMANLDIPAHPQVIFAGSRDARTWLEAEQDNLIASAHHAAGHNLPELAILISHHSWAWLYRRGAWKAVLDMSELGAAVARRSGDRRWECFALLLLADAQVQGGQWEQIFVNCHEALALIEVMGEPSLKAWALNDLGLGYLGLGRYPEAVDHFQRAMQLSPGAQRGRFKGVIETNLSAAHLNLGHYRQALAHAERGLVLRRQAADREGEIHALLHIARAWQGLEAHSEAIAACERAVSVGHDHGPPTLAASILDTLGVSLQHTGDVERAVTCWREALDIFDRFADPRAAELRARLHALEEPNALHAAGG
jgi:tetratricopeptide (TPR) repeat protein